MDLFDHQANQHRQTQAPLADRMRPRTLDEYVGQEHIIAPGDRLEYRSSTNYLASNLQTPNSLLNGIFDNDSHS